LLGVGHESNTSIHLGEYRAPGARRVEAGAPILEGGCGRRRRCGVAPLLVHSGIL
jgi:aminoglycoside N3'-acetyltransferase